MTRNNADFAVETKFIPGGPSHRVVAINRSTGKEVGYLNVGNPDVLGGSQVMDLHVDEEHRRKGVATKMWNHMYDEMYDLHGTPPEHDWNQMTPEGRKWAEAVGD
jgi:ribosomal protein S18 acetylase RimI-like enzyme